ncbi:MAG: transcriptional repressor [Bacteroidales bacterium]|nr:transcriptional repressor [Candidatus Physcousia equi]
MNFEQKLTDAGIRLTAIRLLVYRTIYEKMQNAFSLSDVMQLLPYADNSSVFRTLSLFAEHHLLHLIDDGSGKQKYCVCRCGKFTCQHVHLSCTRCGETICLKESPIPKVDVPQGYVVEETELIIKGICPKCQK